jgi:uncharacterized protein
MKRLLFLLAISMNMLYCMETKPDKEQQESIPSVNNQIRLWQLLGNADVPNFKFIAALSKVNQPEASFQQTLMPEELKEYVLDLKKRFGEQILKLVSKHVLSESDRESIKLLIEAGADLNIQDNSGRNPLTTAAEYGNDEGVKLLISGGADVNSHNIIGNTALIIAAQWGFKSIVADLLNASADVDAQNQNGHTALISAADKGHADIVELLLDANADVNLPDDEGRTALLWATTSNFLPIIALLLANGADVTIKDKMGMTALDQAFLPETIKLLERALPSTSNS